MSFRRYVGKTVHITAQAADGGEVEYTARLFDYDDAGIWLHHSGQVHLPGNRQQAVDGLLFLPHSRIVNVFAYDGLDELLADELRQQQQAGAAREAAASEVQAQRDPADKAVIDSVGQVAQDQEA
jgi:hypothetical protein